jgi:chemotaxis protein CheZ
MTVIVQDDLRSCIREEIAPLFDELRRFTDRRIAELSAEVHATVQLVDYSETNLSNQLAKIQGQVSALVAVPAAATRNSGLELEMVVQATEAAANQIMEAAEAIGDWLRDGGRDAASLEVVANRLSAIFEACSFQDVTGQRVRRAIHHLQQVETMLSELMPAGATTVPPYEPAQEQSQEEIDRLMNGPDAMQADIDRLLNDDSPHVPGAPIAGHLGGADLMQAEIDRLLA